MQPVQQDETLDRVLLLSRCDKERESTLCPWIGLGHALRHDNGARSCTPTVQGMFKYSSEHI